MKHIIEFFKGLYEANLRAIASNQLAFQYRRHIK